MRIDPKPDWGNAPNFKVPIVEPAKSKWQKFRSFFTPQVNAVIVAWALTGIGWGNSRSKVQELQSKVQDLQFTNSTLKADIGKLTIEKTALESQQAVYSSIPFQVPKVISGLESLLSNDPTNRQAILAMKDAVQAVTNLLADIAAIPTFAVFLNNALLTNKAIVHLDESRTLKIRVSNLSATTAEHLSMEFTAPLAISTTNFSNAGWQLMAGRYNFNEGKYIDIKSSNGWLWQANNIIAQHQAYDVASLYFPTNITFPVIQVQFSVYANRSKYQSYLLSLAFDSPGKPNQP